MNLFSGERPMKKNRRSGQATTEVVLTLPILMLFVWMFTKLFLLLILVQKLEIASYYAARRWQLESHRNVQYEQKDGGGNFGCEGQFQSLCGNIEHHVRGYLGCTGGPLVTYLGLAKCDVEITRQNVWNEVSLTANVTLPFVQQVKEFRVTKYVPNRDRPIAYVLPGLQ